MTRYEVFIPTAGLSFGVLGWPVFTPRARLTLKRIQDEVADYYGLAHAHMLSPSRCRPHARPRQVAMYLGRQLTKLSLPDIGRRFGGRDHTTVIHAIRVVKQRIETEPELADDIAALKMRLAA